MALYLGVGKVFASWLEGRIKKYQFIENQDFVSISQNGEKPQGGRPSIDYHLTLDMAKELAMVENNAKGREVRRYFIRMEKLALAASVAPKLKSGQHFADIILPDFTNPAIAARAWADTIQMQADTAQAQADKARAWADEYERRVAAEAQSPASSHHLTTNFCYPRVKRRLFKPGGIVWVHKALLPAIYIVLLPLNNVKFSMTHPVLY